jgi:hypothetical protein
MTPAPLVAALAVATAALAGHLASGIGASGAAGDAVSAGPVEVVPPSGWRLEPGSPEVPGLRLENAAAARAPNGDGRMVLAAIPDLVFAQDLGHAVAGSAPEPDGVRLGRLEAYRWRDIRAGGDGAALTLFAAPTDMGAAVLACSGGATALRRCESAAATLDAPGAEPVALDALAFYGDGVAGALRRLDRMRGTALGRLRAAKARAGQAAAAMELRRAHTAAVGELEALAPPPGARETNDSLAESLGKVASGYADVARAARRGRRGAYAAAARSVERREATLRRALERL